MWTYPPRRILVAVDFGDASARAVRVAGEMSRAYKANLVALHAEALEAPPYFSQEQIRTLQKQRKAARAEAVRYVTRFVERLTPVAFEPRLSDESPAEAVLQASRECDLVVMGTHGRRGPARWWAGSVAERVIRQARVPVLVVPGTASIAQPFKRIAVVARGGTFDGAARRYAKGLAATFEGEPVRESGASIKAATLQDASLVVLARPAQNGITILPRAEEQTIRTCRRPMLFVPAV